MALQVCAKVYWDVLCVMCRPGATQRNLSWIKRFPAKSSCSGVSEEDFRPGPPSWCPHPLLSRTVWISVQREYAEQEAAAAERSRAPSHLSSGHNRSQTSSVRTPSPTNSAGASSSGLVAVAGITGSDLHRQHPCRHGQLEVTRGPREASLHGSGHESNYVSVEMVNGWIGHGGATTLDGMLVCLPS
jgi:hypothetical protein